MMPVPPPRMHVLMRPGAPRAVVLRQGPSRVFCTIGWDLASDRFTVGQWCKHKLYVHRCDLSADGQWMVYFALDGKWRSETRGAFTALSRAPYLKAVRLWPQGNTWGGGGVLYASQAELPPGLEEQWTALRQVEGHNRLGGGSYAERLRRDGWTRAGNEKASAGGKAYQRELGAGWVLRKKVVAETEHHQLRAPDGALRALPTWGWAELDRPRSRVVWAEAGVLHAAALGPDGPGTPVQLLDARGMTFEPLRAPYDDDTVFEP
ncbi:MAG: hypothetical protein IT370_25125 [Deltaproteobacteria bacterium]|nr:hypothetical protein [Deltaproteobacteria bacterium]